MLILSVRTRPEQKTRIKKPWHGKPVRPPPCPHPVAQGLGQAGTSNWNLNFFMSWTWNFWGLNPCVFSSSIATITFASSLILIIGVVVEINFSTFLWLAILPEVRQVLTRLEENLDQVVEHGFILVVDESGGDTHIANACSAACDILAVEHEVEE